MQDEVTSKPFRLTVGSASGWIYLRVSKPAANVPLVIRELSEWRQECCQISRAVHETKGSTEGPWAFSVRALVLKVLAMTQLP